MKMHELSKRLTYVGAGIGLVLFALFGLLPGSFIGGVLGLNIAGKIFGIPITPTVPTKIIIALMMILGVIVSAVLFIMSTAILGWLIGYIIGAIFEKKTVAEEKQ